MIEVLCSLNLTIIFKFIHQVPETVVKDEVQVGQVHVEIDNDKKTNKGTSFCIVEFKH